MGPVLRLRWLLAALAGIAVAVLTTSLGGSPSHAAGVPLSIAIQGNHFVNGAGQTIQLHGVNVSSSEYACVDNYGVADDYYAAEPAASNTAAAIASWGANAVRIPLNEDCWLGLNGVKTGFSATAYRTAVLAAVDLLGRNGMAAILDLHWSAPGAELATAQQPMADLDHSPAFWRSVGAAVLGRTNVLLDLYNEPYGISWSCWLAGGCTAVSTRGTTYTVAGMNRLVAAVRAREPEEAVGEEQELALLHGGALEL